MNGGISVALISPSPRLGGTSSAGTDLVKRSLQNGEFAHLGQGAQAGLSAGQRVAPGLGMATVSCGGVALDSGKGGRDAEDNEFEKR